MKGKPEPKTIPSPTTSPANAAEAKPRALTGESGGLSECREMGIRFVRLGAALMDEDTDVRKLARLAMACGLHIRFELADQIPANQKTD